jgi:hypothetical protein
MPLPTPQPLILLSLLSFVLIAPHSAHALFGEKKQETPQEELAKAIFARPTDATATNAVEVEIGNYRYTIPENYFENLPKKGCNAETELFLGTLPEFRAHTPEERKKHISGDPSKDKTIRVLVGADFKRRQDAQQQLESWWKTASQYMGSHLKTEYPVYGLTYHRAEYPTSKGGGTYKKSDVFQNIANDGKIIGFIRCSILGNTRNPQCSHYFVMNDLVIDAGYSRQYLYQWREIEVSIRAFLKRSNPVKLEKLSPECDGGNFD